VVPSVKKKSSIRIITIKMPDEIHRAIIAARKSHGDKAFIEVVRDYIRLGLVLDENPGMKIYVGDATKKDEQGNFTDLKQLSWE
jgi:hypothetical protein